MTTSNSIAQSVLSTLSPEARQALSDHFRSQIASELVSSSGGSPAPAAPAPRRSAAAPAAPKAKREINRQLTSDLTEKGEDPISGSEWVRRYDAANPDTKAGDVVVAAEKVGLEIKKELVYNVRNQAAKKAAAAAEAAAAAKEERKAKRAAKKAQQQKASA